MIVELGFVKFGDVVVLSVIFVLLSCDGGLFVTLVLLLLDELVLLLLVSFVVLF